MSEEGHEEGLDDGALSEDDSVAEAERHWGNQQLENEDFLRRMRHYSSVLGIPLPYVGHPPGHVGSPDRSDPNDSDRSDPNDANADIGSQHQDSENDLRDEDESDKSSVDSSDDAVAENQNEDQIVAAADGGEDDEIDDDDEIDEGPPELNEEELLEWDLDRDTTDPGSDGFSSDPWALEDSDINGSPPKRRRLSDFCAIS